MKKYTRIIIAVLIVILLGFGLWQIRLLHSRSTQPEKQVQQISTTLKIDGTTSQSFNISDFVGKTALEATEANAKVVTNGTGVNAFITAINGRAANTKKHEFWELDANGAETQVGAGSYIIQKGDSILWHINTY